MTRRINYVMAVAFVLYMVNTAYIAAVAEPTLVYVTGVLAHAGGGVLLTILTAWLLVRSGALRGTLGRATLASIPAAATGLYLIVRGNTSDQERVLWAHIVAGGAGTLVVLVAVWRHARLSGGRWLRLRDAFAAGCAALVLVPAAVAARDRLAPNPADRIRNPATAPLSMHDEGGGPQSPFFPSAARTNVGGIIPANFFMESESCGACHRDIYEQWRGSMHRFASFNNQFYRKSIEYMQEVVGTQPSKWCAGCHDHAVFFNGRFDRPIKEQLDTPEAHAGLGCTSCHSIVHVDSSMGNGGFTIEYPKLHDLATSDNPIVRTISKYFTYLDPAPHRRSFMKPFMREDSAEYCSTCHKVHLDVPVNEYRWIRGFNDYDAWQASGVSGQGARSFYYPKTTSMCRDCHMPLVASTDPAARDGKVRSHRFPGANTAVPFVNHDREQLQTTTGFLKSGFVSVDIFAVTPAETVSTPMVRRGGDTHAAMTTFGVGDEAESAPPAAIREVGRVSAPIDRAGTQVQPGSTARVDVVVRTRRIGHLFPGGTVDAFDVWLELQARDATGRLLFWSGKVDDEGRGPVEAGAHFYRAYLLDGEGNPINKRNAWQARTLLYSRLIPPGAADVAHFRLRIPEDVQGPITVTAKLNHRKFSHYYTQFAYAGRPRAGQSPALLSASFNGLEYEFGPAGIPANVSGRVKGAIPDLPIVTLAEASATLGVTQAGSAPDWTPRVTVEDRERWNDWGIGLLLQGDLKGAEYAFRQVTKAEPGYVDGWVNVARALVQEGQTDAAKPFLAQALRLDPALPRAHYFHALVQKADGQYDAALASLDRVLKAFPRDRVVLNQAARILFLQRRFADALVMLDRVGAIDPEDVQMHYTKMLCFRAVGDAAAAAREEKLFRRYKADEASQAITARRRSVSPEDNNERQPIHDHESVALAGGVR